MWISHSSQNNHQHNFNNVLLIIKFLTIQINLLKTFSTNSNKLSKTNNLLNPNHSPSIVSITIILIKLIKEINSLMDSLNPTLSKKNIKLNTICLLKPFIINLFTDPDSINLKILILSKISYSVFKKVGKTMTLSLPIKLIKLISTPLQLGIYSKLSYIN